MLYFFLSNFKFVSYFLCDILPFPFSITVLSRFFAGEHQQSSVRIFLLLVIYFLLFIFYFLERTIFHVELPIYSYAVIVTFWWNVYYFMWIYLCFTWRICTNPTYITYEWYVSNDGFRKSFSRWSLKNVNFTKSNKIRTWEYTV